MAGRVVADAFTQAADDGWTDGGRAPGGLTLADPLPILLVDDHPENLRTLEAVLEPLGYPLESAGSGAEALRKLLERDFALILLDVRMPVLDGLETAALIKGRARSRDVPIVFLTASRSDLGEVLRGYGVGAVDFVMKPFDPELLRSKVAVFAALEGNRRALKRSESFLRGAFEAAPIGKTVLDGDRRIVRSNPAFAGLLRRRAESLAGVDVAELAHEEDRDALAAALERIAARERIAAAEPGAAELTPATVDVRLLTSDGGAVWVEAVVSAIEPEEHASPPMLVQWVDLTARRRVEQARSELVLEQAARLQAEAVAERLTTLQQFSDALDSLSLPRVLAELAGRLAERFGAERLEVELRQEDQEHPLILRAEGGEVRRATDLAALPPGARWHELTLAIQRSTIATVRLALAPGRALGADEAALLEELGERAVLAIRRAQLHEQERRIAEELQRGLLPARLPDVAHVELAAHYQAAGLGAEAGGDWYDAFALPGERVGIVVGDVTGRGIKAASTMGQLRSVTRAFALGDAGLRSAGEVLTRLNRYQLAQAEMEMFSVLYAIVDPRGGWVQWASGGHPPALLRTRAREVRYLEGGNELMGIADVVYDSHEAAVAGDDTLILYSDGLIERRGEVLDAGFARLAEAAKSGPDAPQALRRHLLTRMLPEDADLHDDVTAMLVRVLRHPPTGRRRTGPGRETTIRSSFLDQA
ncbi:MAG: SpoIIE family protein phosphatase [Solirubrobacterales bacterium]|nr:SpoIIE family protein phosphatase [Solirubrobacterales bacterium]